MALDAAMNAWHVAVRRLGGAALACDAQLDCLPIGFLGFPIGEQNHCRQPPAGAPPARGYSLITAERRPRAVDPPTSAPACAAVERRHLGVWSACAAEGKCIAPSLHIVLLDLV